MGEERDTHLFSPPLVFFFFLLGGEIMGMRLPPDTLLIFQSMSLRRNASIQTMGEGLGDLVACDQYRYNREYEYQRKTFETLPCL